jgi:hypothetical protein
MRLQAAAEGDTDVPIVRKLAADAGFEIHGNVIDCAGKSGVDRQLAGYNGSANGSPWLVLRDLDHDAGCAPAFLAACAFKPSRWMCFRIAVRELESWILADAEAFSAFYGVPLLALPEDPDGEADPTATIIRLVHKSRDAAVRRAVLPRPGSLVQVGPRYEDMLIEFGKEHWDLSRACNRSDSLWRARRALRQLSSAWSVHVGGFG